MSIITVTKPSQEELKNRGVHSWPIWEKEASRFDWYYDDEEQCYLPEGKVMVETKEGARVEFGKGDFVTFPRGLACVWTITEPVRKHYRFG